MRSLSAVRGITGSASTWSKSQKNAVISLQRFAETRDPRDFKAFQNYLNIIYNYRISHLEVIKPKPDVAVIRRSLEAAGAHPDDVIPMYRFLRDMRKIPDVIRSMKLWAESDQALDRLRDEGYHFRDLLIRKAPRREIEASAARIQTLNDELTHLENLFSDQVGVSSRMLESMINQLLLGVVLTVGLFALVMTYFTVRRIRGGLGDLRLASERIGAGELSHRVPITSLDEIGSLAQAINRMGELLEQSYSELEDRVRDRTAILKEMAEENARLYEKAREAVRNRDDFLSIASHELRTPLCALQLQIGLATQQETTPSNRHLMQGALQQSRRLGDLVYKLLDLTLIRQNGFTVNRERSDLSALVADAVERMQASAAQSGSDLSFESTGPLTCPIDSLRVEQIIINLVSNAIKYGKGCPISVFVGQQGEQATVVVSDQGPGVPLELHESIFDRFERGRAEQQTSGLGLGLYIAQQIAKAHSGLITLKSEEGRGAVFTLRLPLHVPEEVLILEATQKGSPRMRAPLTLH
jgi:hypothetical protein